MVSYDPARKAQRVAPVPLLQIMFHNTVKRDWSTGLYSHRPGCPGQPDPKKCCMRNFHHSIYFCGDTLLKPIT
ncbi:hypothetical protein HNR39_000834 [Glaciimonas immobilis]|uniref:Uncharacterized protein n=1 Tax=Glaciimonas immobilis TaxID=728004 RepID=A0A840RQM4_9BURK|nr:hypothetical protein [Glaciimonas immobilis]